VNKFFFGLLLSLVAPVGAQAQKVEGDWQGTLKTGPVELRLELHIAKDEKGALKGTLDSIDQNAMGLQMSSISVKDSVLRFEIQVVGGSYEGQLTADLAKISGTWSQGGGSLPLEFTRITARPEVKKKAVKSSDIDGDWEGTLGTGSESLRLVLHILTYEDGMTAKLDSPDQSSMGLPVTTIVRDGKKLKFEMKGIAGSFAGTINTELTVIDGTWTQLGNSSPLVFKRVNPASKEKKSNNF
jgi:hypothetical protein